MALRWASLLRPRLESCLGACVAMMVFASACGAAELPKSVRDALRVAGIPISNVGIVVQEIGRAAPELSLGETRSFNPASVMKLVTTLAALDQLGPAHTWTTRVLITGEVRDGVLEGDLVLQGGGDPALTQERFWALLRAVREKGIHEIRGDVRLDESLYAIEATDPGAFDNAPLKPYNAAPSALLVNNNLLALRLAEQDGQISGRLDPPALPVEFALQSGVPGACEDWDEDITLQRAGDVLRVEGRYPAGCDAQQLYLNLLCPSATVAVMFRALWRELGGVFEGQVRVEPTPESAREWLQFASPPVSGIVRDINKHSNNVMAKMLFLNLGVARYGGAAGWDKSARALRAWLEERGLRMPELVIQNGSGLSRIERISPASMAQLLLWAAAQPVYYEFAASLPAIGLEGTQKRRLKGRPEAGKGWLKTGTLNGSRALAGYVMDGAGRRKLLVFFVNHRQASQVAAAQNALLEWVISGAPDTAASAGNDQGMGKNPDPER